MAFIPAASIVSVRQPTKELGPTSKMQAMNDPNCQRAQGTVHRAEVAGSAFAACEAVSQALYEVRVMDAPKAALGSKLTKPEIASTLAAHA
jgi:hypothetical protein